MTLQGWECRKDVQPIETSKPMVTNTGWECGKVQPMETNTD